MKGNDAMSDFDETEQAPRDEGPGMPPEGIPDRPVIDGVHDITQSPKFDPMIDSEDEIEEGS